MEPVPDASASYDAGSADELQALAASLAPQLQAGDLLVLSGELGAGKTTFTQGLGCGLAIEDRIISPTFVLVRQHRSRGDRPGLVHVDAYRLESAAAVDDLDLEATLDANITVIEWGVGRVEHLADSWLRVHITRPLGGAGPGGPGAGIITDFDDDGEDEVRTVTLSGAGPRWRGGLPALSLD